MAAPGNRREGELLAPKPGPHTVPDVAKPTPARRSSDARRPDITVDVARIGAVCAAAEALHPTLVTARDVAVAVSNALKATPAPATEAAPDEVMDTNRTVVVQAVSSFVHQRCLTEMDLTAGQVKAGACSSDLRTTQAKLAALRASGIDTRDLEEGLRPYRRRVQVRALMHLQELAGTERSIRAGELRTALVQVFDTTVHTPGTVRSLQRHGIDTQLLFDAAVHFEAGRHINLVKHQANRLVRAYPHYRPEDLFGWGWRGLVVALRNYDPARYAFSTYACVRIKGAIQDGARAESPVPKRLGTYRRRVRGIEQELEQRLGREPSQDELAEAVAEDHCRRALGRTPTLAEVAARIESERTQLELLPRLSEPSAIDDAELAGLLVNTDVDNEVMTRLRAEAVRDAVASLPVEEAEAVTLLDLHELSLDEAAHLTGATQRQLRSRRQRGRAMLETALADWR